MVHIAMDREIEFERRTWIQVVGIQLSMRYELVVAWESVRMGETNR